MLENGNFMLYWTLHLQGVSLIIVTLFVFIYMDFLFNLERIVFFLGISLLRNSFFNSPLSTK
jgi:hypothetical protein